jgi:hypothetical protein
MKKITQLCLGLFMLFFVAFFAAPMNLHASEEQNNDVTLIYAHTPEGWEAPHVWTWDADGVAAFAKLGWPGKQMIADTNNPGWYYLYIPASMENVIINANGGTVQTDAFPVAGENLWVTITSVVVGEETTITAIPSTTKETTGNLPTYIPTKYVYAYVPVEWDTAGIWAWEHPAGTNVFPSWPGAEMDLQSDGWFMIEIPTVANRVIINNFASSDTLQTVDVAIDENDVYIVVKEVNTNGKYEVEIFSEKPIFMGDAFKLFIAVPEGWETPHIWAWSHPDGTGLFTTWPGEALEFDAESGYYVIILPNWINRVIINNGIVGDGAQQTVDVAIEEQVDSILTVGEANDEGKFLATVTPVGETEDPIDEEPTSNLLLIVVLSVLGVAAIGGGVFLYLKKK